MAPVAPTATPASASAHPFSPFTSPAQAPAQAQPSRGAKLVEQQKVADPAIAQKEKELQRREAELEKRFEELSKRERELGTRAPRNWPRCYPIVYHAIDEEIPEYGRSQVRGVYYSYLALVTALVWNWICVTADLRYVGGAAVGQWLLAVIFVMAGVPGAWFLWYGRVYSAVKDDSALQYVKFFAGYAAHIGFLIIAFVSPPIGNNDYALAGIVPGFKFLGEYNKKALGILYLVGAVIWGVQILLCVGCMKTVYNLYRSKGHSTAAAAAAAGIPTTAAGAALMAASV